MNNREMLELAAKAAGYTINSKKQVQRDELVGSENASLYLADGSTEWNPRDNSGQALDLAADIGLLVNVDHDRGCVRVISHNRDISDPVVTVLLGEDSRAATRLAIFLSAVTAGKAMP